jgi:hypothetical protein
MQESPRGGTHRGLAAARTHSACRNPLFGNIAGIQVSHNHDSGHGMFDRICILDTADAGTFRILTIEGETAEKIQYAAYAHVIADKFTGLLVRDCCKVVLSFIAPRHLINQ